MKLQLMGVLLFFLVYQSDSQAQNPEQKVKESLQYVKNGNINEARNLLEQLSQLQPDELEKSLVNQSTAKTFWVNLYNVIVQVLLIEDASRYENRDKFFEREWFTIAGKALSLDDIEHGIIRGSKHKYTLGYTEKIFVNDFEERFRLQTLDYRVHFALNCGAKSCPPVVIYDPELLDAQLTESARRYLKKEVKMESEKVLIPKLCQWFYGDFGGAAGIEKMLRKYLEKDNLPKEIDLEYLDYDWTLQTGHFVN